MSISRRKFLKLLVTAMGGGIAGYGAFQYLMARFPEKVWSLNSWLTMPVLEDIPPGPLSEQVLQTLIATVQTLIVDPVEMTHYQDFFRWHAETLPGYKALYDQFTLEINQSTRRAAGCEFVNCEVTTRCKILEKAFEIREVVNRVDKIRLGIFERNWLLFDRYIIQEIFSLFARTDALVLLGYDTWPGMPRGLDKYVNPPAQAVFRKMR